MQKAVLKIILMGLLTCLSGLSFVSKSQDKADIQNLQHGSPIERTLSGGKVHTYEINLDAGRFCHLTVDQRGVDVVVTLYGPDNKALFEVDGPRHSQGPEWLLVLAETAATYRVEVRPVDKEWDPLESTCRHASLSIL